MSVSIGCDDLKNSVVDGQERDVKGATTQIEDEYIDRSLSFGVESVRDRSLSRASCASW